MKRDKANLFICVLSIVGTLLLVVGVSMGVKNWMDFMRGVSGLLLVMFLAGWMHELRAQLRGDKDNA